MLFVLRRSHSWPTWNARKIRLPHSRLCLPSAGIKGTSEELKEKNFNSYLHTKHGCFWFYSQSLLFPSADLPHPPTFITNSHIWDQIHMSEHLLNGCYSNILPSSNSACLQMSLSCRHRALLAMPSFPSDKGSRY